MFNLKKKSLIIYLIAFIILQPTFIYVMSTTIEIPFDSKDYILLFILSLAGMLWSSYALWRDTTDIYLEKMNSSESKIIMLIISVFVWFMMGYRMYTDFYLTSFNQEHPFLLIAIVLPYVVSVNIFFKVAYTRIFMLWAKIRGVID